MAKLNADGNLMKVGNKRYLVLNWDELHSDARECEGYVERFLF